MKTILTGLGSNVTGKDAQKAFSFFLPWRWFEWDRGDYGAQAVRSLSSFLQTPFVFLCDSGRSAIVLALKAIGVEKGDRVAVQAYTCMVVANAIHAVGAKPVFIDVDNHGNMSSLDLKQKIDSQVRAIIIQHTFGIPADLNRILAVANERGIRTIEDCAHALGGEKDGKQLGTFGDIGIFSFGSDKVISTSRGGAITTSSKELAHCLEEEEKRLPPLSSLIIARHLVSFPIFWVGRRLYDFFWVGKAFLKLCAFVGLIPRIITRGEKRGVWPAGTPARLPNALAAILLNQLHTLPRTLAYRRELAHYYAETLHYPFDEEGTYLRYPVFVNKAEELLQKAKKKKIILGDWYQSVVAPSDSQQEASGYREGGCPNAERLARLSVNLPTHQYIRIKDVHRILALLKDYV